MARSGLLGLLVFAVGVTLMPRTAVSDIRIFYSTFAPCGDDPVSCFGEWSRCDALVNSSGRVIRRFPTPYEIRGPFREGLLLVLDLEENQFGYIDTTGEFAIDRRFDLAGPFSNGLARVCAGDLCGFIDRSGEVVISLQQFSVAEDFGPDGFARIYKGWNVDRRVGFINDEGEVVIEPTLFAAGDFSGGVAPVVTEGPCWQETRKPTIHEIIDYFGTTRQEQAENRKSGQSSELPHCEWVLIRPDGSQVSERRFLDVRGLSDGLAAARVGENWGYINTQGEFEVRPDDTNSTFRPAPAEEDYAHPFSDGLAAVPVDKETWKFIDRQGGTAFTVEGDFPGDFRNGLAPIFDPETVQTRYVDKTGRVAIPRAFDGGYEFCHGVTEVSIDGDDGVRYNALIDTSGNELFTWPAEKKDACQSCRALVTVHTRFRMACRVQTLWDSH